MNAATATTSTMTSTMKMKMKMANQGMGGKKCLARATQRGRRAGGVDVRAAAAGFVPDMPRRQLMNALLLGAVGLPATSMLAAYAYFFVPKG